MVEISKDDRVCRTSCVLRAFARREITVSRPTRSTRADPVARDDIAVDQVFQSRGRGPLTFRAWRRRNTEVSGRGWCSRVIHGVPPAVDALNEEPAICGWLRKGDVSLTGARHDCERIRPVRS